METARITDKMKTDSLRRGFIGVNHKCYMRPEEMIDFMKDSIRTMGDRREEIWNLMDRPNKQNLKNWRKKVNEHRHSKLLREYFMLGDKIYELNCKLKEIGKEVKVERASYSALVLSVADELYGDGAGEAIKKAALNRLHKTVNPEDWEGVVDRIFG